MSDQNVFNGPPNWCKFAIPAKEGWINPATGEILVSIGNNFVLRPEFLLNFPGGIYTPVPGGSANTTPSANTGTPPTSNTTPTGPDQTVGDPTAPTYYPGTLNFSDPRNTIAYMLRLGV